MTSTKEPFKQTKPVFAFSLSRDHLNSGLGSQVKKRVSEIRLKVHKNLAKLGSIDLKSDQVEIFKQNLEEKLEILKQTQTVHKAIENIEDFTKNSATELQQKLWLEARKTTERLEESSALIKKIREKNKLAKREFDELQLFFRELTQKEEEISTSIDQLKLGRLRFIREQNVLFRIKSEEEVRDLESRFAMKPDKKPPLIIEVNINQSSNRKLLNYFLIFIWLLVLGKYLNLNL